MTQALQQAFGATVKVQVLCDGSGKLLADEVALLDAPVHAGHVREVILTCGPMARMAARTVYVSTTLRADLKLRSLGARPLGELLFAEGQPEWLKREFAMIEAGTPLSMLVRRATGRSDERCWARRTVFLLGHERLLVTEIFLPAMLPPGLTVPTSHSSTGRHEDASGAALSALPL